jgi:hypothetical protein
MISANNYIHKNTKYLLVHSKQIRRNIRGWNQVGSKRNRYLYNKETTVKGDKL